MKIPHHLHRAPSGIWHFRRRVPVDLLAQFGRPFFKVSLRTRVLSLAQVRALVASLQLDVVFSTMRGSPVARKTRGDEATASFDYHIRLPDGLVISAQGEEDHARALEMMRLAVAAPANTGPAQSSHDRGNASVSGIDLAEAARKWVLTLEGVTKPKTLRIKRTAVDGFARWRGKRPLSDITRTDISEWMASLRNNGCATPTLANKASYLKGFFDWAIGAGHYPQGDNPARGQVKFGKREKQQRKAYGFQPLSRNDIACAYAPAELVRLSEGARWAALIGLFTGARVNEIGQLHLTDFVQVDGVACVTITDEGEGQSLKTAASMRTVPLHPHLIQLGIMGRVSHLVASGQDRFFPKLMQGSVNGQGNAFSSAFSRHLKRLEIKPAGTRKLGFHSLRKTAIQAMQDGGVASEFRAQYVGHDLDDEHHGTYSRRYTPKELAGAIHPALDFNLDLEGIAAVLGAPKKRAAQDHIA